MPRDRQTEQCGEVGLRGVRKARDGLKQRCRRGNSSDLTSTCPAKHQIISIQCCFGWGRPGFTLYGSVSVSGG